MSEEGNSWDVIVVGGGCAGLSAAIYLARAMRRVLVVDGGQSLALWEPDVQNYFGFPEGISGEELLERGRNHVGKYNGEFVQDEISSAGKDGDYFSLQGKKKIYRARRVLLATGAWHIPPEIPHVAECLGHSMFFCKDCDGFRNQDKQIAIVGQNNEAVEYALGMLCYASCVLVATNGKTPRWDQQHADWVAEYKIPIYESRISGVAQENGLLQSLTFEDSRCVVVDALFTTRGDVFHNKLGKELGADLDEEGQIRVDHCMKTSVTGLYAAGCVTPANCQMIISAGNGATAAQAINRDLFEASLCNHELRCVRAEQVATEQTKPIELRE